MCVLKATDRTSILDISMILDDLQYVEFDFSFNLPVITQTLAGRMRSLFADYYIDSTSQIIVSPRIATPKNPFYLYLMFIHQHIGFNLKKVNEDNIVRRISTYHKTYVKAKSKINKWHFNALWNKLIATERCPWISKQIEYFLQTKPLAYAKRKRHCRMALYYMVIREYLMNIKHRSISNSNKI